MKVKFELASGKSIVANLDKKTYLSNHFQLEELANNKGNEKEPQFVISKYSDTFIKMLEEFRKWYANPIVIKDTGCCYRQTEYNKSVGGDCKSAHLMACAVDWHVNHTNLQRNNVMNAWKKICKQNNVIGAINYYTHGYHLEAFSDVCYGNRLFVVRDYRGKKGDW